jgi:hypothetical protein
MKVYPTNLALTNNDQTIKCKVTYYKYPCDKLDKKTLLTPSVMRPTGLQWHVGQTSTSATTDVDEVDVDEVDVDEV